MAAITTQQALRTLASFESWTDKLFSGQISIENRQDDNFQEYKRYCKEILPHIKQYASEVNNEEIKRLSSKIFNEHLYNLEESLRPASGWLGQVLSMVGGSQSANDNSDKYHFALQQLLNDIRNLIYQLKILL